MKLKSLLVGFFKLAILQYLFTIAAILIVIIGYLLLFTPVGVEINNLYLKHLQTGSVGPLVFPAEVDVCNYGKNIEVQVPDRAYWEKLQDEIVQNPNVYLGVCQSGYTPHLASLVSQNQTDEVGVGRLIVIMLVTIFMIATGHGLFSKVKNENLSESEKGLLKLGRIIWIIFLIILIIACVIIFSI